MTNPKILLVDDEINILRACCRVLHKCGYDISSTVSINEGLDLLGRDRFALVMSDYQMPQMCGTDFLEQARNISPDTVRIMLTGFDDNKIVIDAINRAAIFQYILKPWDDEELRKVVKDAVSEFEQQHQSAAVKNTANLTADGSSDKERKINVLIVDDQMNMALAIKRTIKNNFNSGNLIIAGDGKQAWYELRTNDIDLIIADLNMPNQNGYELLLQVRNDEKTSNLPFIMITGSSDKNDIMKVIEARVNDYIVKPFNTKSIVDRIARALSDGRLNTGKQAAH